jgi:hypothetical protein
MPGMVAAVIAIGRRAWSYRHVGLAILAGFSYGAVFVGPMLFEEWLRFDWFLRLVAAVVGALLERRVVRYVVPGAITCIIAAIALAIGALVRFGGTEADFTTFDSILFLVMRSLGGALMAIGLALAIRKLWPADRGGM